MSQQFIFMISRDAMPLRLALFTVTVTHLLDASIQLAKIYYRKTLNCNVEKETK